MFHPRGREDFSFREDPDPAMARQPFRDHGAGAGNSPPSQVRNRLDTAVPVMTNPPSDPAAVMSQARASGSAPGGTGQAAGC
jgi:hypothetical protein